MPQPSQEEIDLFVYGGMEPKTHLERIKAFLNKHGREAVDLKGKFGRTALAWAAYCPSKKDVNVVALLLEHGANPNLRCEDGSIALIWATQNGRYDADGGKTAAEKILKMLLENGADPNCKGRNGEVPLLEAISHGHYNMALSLLEHGAAVNPKDAEGMTVPMHIEKMKECIKFDKDKDQQMEAMLELLSREEWQETQRKIDLAEDIADFSPALKRNIPAPKPIRVRDGPKP
jgi:hypothetical protein